MKYNELIKRTNEYINDGTNIVYLLIEHMSGLEPHELFASIDEEINFDLDEFNKHIDEYKNGKPIQHIVGYEWFMGRKLNCGNGAFIPRYETEQLCEEVIYAVDEFFGEKQNITKADIGTGSGAIALTIDLELAGKTYATEISEDAVKVAKKNFEDTGANVEIFIGNMLDPLVERGVKLDLLVSNPPYIKDGDETLDKSVVDHDPAPALWGGKDGLDFYREILDGAHKILNPKAMMAFEFGWDQKEELEEIVQKKYKNYEFLKDHSDKWRMLLIWIGE